MSSSESEMYESDWYWDGLRSEQDEFQSEVKSCRLEREIDGIDRS